MVPIVQAPQWFQDSRRTTAPRSLLQSFAVQRVALAPLLDAAVNDKMEGSFSRSAFDSARRYEASRGWLHYYTDADLAFVNDVVGSAACARGSNAQPSRAHGRCRLLVHCSARAPRRRQPCATNATGTQES